jgi:HD-GYP domain-containing protein (c-di-GMP phosphodiesterase class II)
MITEFMLQNLPDSDQRLKAMFQAFDDMLFILDQDGTILDYRAGDPSQLYISPDKFLRQRMQDILPPAIGRKIDDALRELHKGSSAARIEYLLPLPSGERWYEARLVSFASQQRGMFVRDITQYKQSELKIRRQLDQLAALRAIDLAISSGLDLNLMMSVILDHVHAQLNIDAACILLLDPKTQLLQYAAGLGFYTSALQYTRLQAGEGYAGQAVQQRRTLHISNLKTRQTDFLRSPYFSTENFVSYYAIPLIAKGQVLGVLEIFKRTALDADGEWLNFMDTLAGQAAIAIDNAMLFKDLQWSNTELMLAYDKTIEGWSRALDLRDKETEFHTRRVTEMTLRLARRMQIPEHELIHIRRGAILHDIGKVAISDSILLKAGPLNEEEWSIMRRHPLIAVELLSPISYLASALPIPRSHHERWEGGGYPDGLIGEQIPLAARIFALADVYDALNSDRPYRKAWSQAATLEFIRTQAGKQFDPKIVPVFIDMVLQEEAAGTRWTTKPAPRISL